MKTKLFTVALIALVLPFVLSGSRGDQRARHVSLVQVLAMPEKFKGELLALRGFYHHELESSAIYLNREDAEYSIQKNGIWIGDRGVEARIERVNDTYVQVEGTFDYSPMGSGHMGLYAAELKNVRLLVELKK